VTLSVSPAGRGDQRAAALRGRVSPPLAFLAVTTLMFGLVPYLASGIVVGGFDVFNGLKSFSSWGLVALALGLTMLIGEFDLSVLGSYGFGALVAVKLGGHNPLVGLGCAVAMGFFVGLAQSTLMTRLKLSSVPVTLGGLLVLLGLTYRISDGKDVPFENINFGLAIDSTVGGVISVRGVITLAVCLVVGLLLSYTAAGRLIRAVGGDRTASESIGLPVDRTVISVFCVSGMFSALAGGMSAFALASAQASIGFQPLSYAVTAALIGGVSLSGGKGSIAGITAAAVSLSLLQGIFQVMSVQVYYSDVILGLLLAVVAGVQGPGLRSLLAARSARHGTAAATT